MEIICRAAKVLVEDIGARPVGSRENGEACSLFEEEGRRLGLAVSSPEFDCLRCRSGEAFVSGPAGSRELFPGPFSPPLKGRYRSVRISTLQELRDKELTGKIAILEGEIAAEPLMPRDFPFFYPDEHRTIIELLEAKRPAAVIAVTGMHPSCGLDPFPLFDDGNFSLPSAYCSKLDLPDGEWEIAIDSERIPSRGRQPILSLEGGKSTRIVLCAHLDTAPETPGAVDNGAGAAVLLGVAELLARERPEVSVDLVPFNGEEYYAVPGQLAYLERRKPNRENTHLAINLDACGFNGSRNAFSFYGDFCGDSSAADASLRMRIDAHIARDPLALWGPEWVEGDHSIFAGLGIPAAALTSSTLREEVVPLTHTTLDTLDHLDFTLLDSAAKLLFEIICGEALYTLQK